ncbi:MAG: tellurite resistance TerB family protein [Notoacmeibacter sp.]|nr:tellurite resistance TerB family protein [Notoacmeibacter sp.]
MEAVSTQEALVYVMVAVSAVDRSMTDNELAKIGSLVRTMPVFAGYKDDRLIETSRQCQQILAKDDGLNRLLDVITAAVPERLRETAYAVAVEIAAADLYVEQEELRLLQLLRDRLEVEKLVAAAIERAAQARFRTA